MLVVEQHRDVDVALAALTVKRARLPCNQARRTVESPRRGCARRSRRLPTASSPADKVTSVSRSDALSVPRWGWREPRISVARSGRKGDASFRFVDRHGIFNCEELVLVTERGGGFLTEAPRESGVGPHAG